MKLQQLGAAAAALMLAACSGAPVSGGNEAAAAPEGAGPLDGQFWQLAGADRGPLAELAHARKVTLGFDEGRAFGYAGCNRYFSPYALRGSRLELASPGSTMMFCDGEAGAVESAFLPLLSQPLTLERQGDRMSLTAPDGTRLDFEAAPEPPHQP